jgi:hypothetical protein
MMHPEFRFQPISSSWVAVHPQPKGVIQFIGGAFFGTFPTIFYRHFLGQLFDAGYTIVAFPFRFSFRHWSIAANLFTEQQHLREMLIQSTQAIRIKQIYQDDTKYFWLGHSLGCKYIQLLEFLSSNSWKEILQEYVSSEEAQRIQNVIEDITGNQKISIKGQSSLLIAPDVSNTESAIPIPLFAKFLDNIGLGVLPTRQQILNCITRSNLFNLTALISFDRDTVAGNKQDEFRDQKVQENSDVFWLSQQLKNKKFPLLHEELPGGHLEPMAIRIANSVIDLSPLTPRLLETVAIDCLTELKQREQQLEEKTVVLLEA